MKKLDISQEHNAIKHLLVETIQGLSYGQWFFSTIHYGDWNDDGSPLDPETRSKHWDINEVKRTHRHLRNLLTEAFRPECLVFFLERHKGIPDQYGDEVRKGKFHTHLLISPIPDCLLESPHSKLRRLWERPSSRGIPINLVKYQDDDLSALKIDLINACLRQADWVNRYSYTLETEPLNTPDDLWRTGHYCLKTYSQKTGLDFLEVIDWENSDLEASKEKKQNEKAANLHQCVQKEQAYAGTTR